MRRLKIFPMFLVILMFALYPAVASGEELDDDDGVILRVNGIVELAQSETIDVVVVISGDANIRGTVEGLVLVIDGVATISGRVDADVTVVNGTLVLESGAVVKNVTLVRSTMTRDPAAEITGEISERSGYSLGWGSVIFSFLFWLGSTIAILAAGVIFAAIGGKQLLRAGEIGSQRIGQSLAGMVVIWLGLPILAVISLITLIGIPLGLGILVFVLPAAAFLGYLVAGTRIGGLITNRSGTKPSGNPYLAAIVGLLLLQLVTLIPFVGGFVAVVAALYGSGALGLAAFLGWRDKRMANLPERVVGP